MEKEVNYLQSQTTTPKNMADACIFADESWDRAAFFAMFSTRCSLVRTDQSKLNKTLRDIQDST